MQVTFAAMYQWIERHSCKVTYRSQTDLFEMLFSHFVMIEGVHYSGAHICQIFRGFVNLPRDLVTRYQINEAYISSLWDGIKTLLTLDFADAPAALAELSEMIKADDTISANRKRNLLHHADFEGGDGSVDWVTDVLRFAMLPRRDTRQKTE